MVIAIAGKGGVGKTTIAGMLVRYLLEEAKAAPVLAVDADPNANLNEVLGLSVEATIGSARERLKRDVPQGMSKDSWFEYRVNEAVAEGNGFDLIVMGRPEGPGCYCAANSLAKKYIEALRDNYPYVVVDNEAGMEHMSRLVTNNVDELIIVSDPSPRGLRTAARIRDLVGELDLTVRATRFVVNRLAEGQERMVRDTLGRVCIEADGMIGEDRALMQGDLEGTPVFALDGRCGALKQAYGIFRGILGR